MKIKFIILHVMMKEVYNYTEYRARRREKPTPQRIKIPLEDYFSIDYEYNGLLYNININIHIEEK